MNQILELREKRAKLWDSAKAFLDSRLERQAVPDPEFRLRTLSFKRGGTPKRY